MHALIWFWTTGIHDPAWVQAVAAIAMVLFTAVTLVVLVGYARDTRTLARVSVEQIRLMKVDRENDSTLKWYALARRCSLVQAKLTSLKKSLENGSFETSKREKFYPEDWVDIAISLRSPGLLHHLSAALHLGNKLWNLDLAVKYYFDAATTAEKAVCKERVSEILTEATASVEEIYSNKYGVVIPEVAEEIYSKRYGFVIPED
jgi:hypothetical protein